ncbi:hypothetical protein EDC65_3046 [Stella humosa]|uniref:Uncharacterized protein n=1 Tax=Stella humosa TaxID=94 RepID=A0A3N1L916_9PROT|nr:hypothetical protein [Stella humosa]ROP91183.1 hypothetical protein EDC65_3046 [Stella humosa]BBK34465.1 hypothetical protein STHU_50990 [Stella humosa]
MAKGQQRSNRETKKPKQAAKTKTGPIVSPFSTLPPGKAPAAGAPKKK